MRKRITAAELDESPKRRRRGARKCPCCSCAPCACEASCFCQELKSEMPDDENDDAGFEGDLRFSFLRHAEAAA